MCIAKKTSGLMAPCNNSGELLFKKYPEALTEFMELIKNSIVDDVLEKSVEFHTQNQNESAHGKLWNIFLHKFKAHDAARVEFCMNILLLQHNFGYFKSSLHHRLGTMTPSMANSLTLKDRRSRRNSEYQWIPSGTAFKTHRKKGRESTKHAEFLTQRRISMLEQMHGNGYLPGQGDGNPNDPNDIPDINISDLTINIVSD